MSLLSSVGGVLKGAVGGLFTGGLPGAVVGGVMGGMSQPKTTSMPKMPTMPGGATRGTLPALAGAGGGGMGGLTGRALGGLGAAGRGVASVARGAASMCAKYPAWCLAAGGVAAVANLMHSGQLPIPKRRRRRGITPRDLHSFRRVANLIKAYSGPVHHMRTKPRGTRSCR